MKFNLNKSGFTLIELMIGSVISIGLLAVAVNFFTNLTKNNSSTQNSLLIRANSLLFIQTLKKDLQIASSVITPVPALPAGTSGFSISYKEYDSSVAVSLVAPLNPSTKNIQYSWVNLVNGCNDSRGIAINCIRVTRTDPVASIIFNGILNIEWCYANTAGPPNEIGVCPAWATTAPSDIPASVRAVSFIASINILGLGLLNDGQDSIRLLHHIPTNSTKHLKIK